MPGFALHDQAILLNTLHWPDEIRDAGQLSLPSADTDVHARELEMAVMLIENLSASFDPERYRDEYRDAVITLVEAKLRNEPVEHAPAPAAANVTDLMAALKASVEASQGSAGTTSTLRCRGRVNSRAPPGVLTGCAPQPGAAPPC